MACLEMYNSEHKLHHNHHCSPRISFSNDFVDTNQASKLERNTTRSDAPVSTDFEFSVSNYSMMSADELFCKGRLLPFKDSKRPTTTLREELLVGDDDEDKFQGSFSLRPPKGSSNRWKGFLGLRKSHIGSKKVEKSESGKAEARKSGFLVNKGTNLNITSQVIFLFYFIFIYKI